MANDYYKWEGNPQDIVQVANPTSEDITVQYGGVPHTVRAGETNIFTRFLAEHICKHLTDRELKREQDKTKKPLLVADPNRRRAWHDKIIVGTVQTYGDPKKMTHGEQVAVQQESIRKQYEAKIQHLEEKVESIAKQHATIPDSDSRPSRKAGPGRGRKAEPVPEPAQ